MLRIDEKHLVALSLALSTSAFAVDDPGTRVWGWVRAGASSATAAVSSFGFASGSGASLSWNRVNQVAVTEAAPRLGTAFAASSRSAWTISQSRLGAEHCFAGEACSAVEIDFVDADRAQATTTIRPRLRHLGARVKLSERVRLFAGQDWDISAGVKPVTYNFISLYFRAGNIGFFRPQARLELLDESKTERAAFMLGAAGLTDSVSNDSSVERGALPIAGIRVWPLRSTTLKLGSALLATQRRFENSALTESTRRWVYAVNAFTEWNPIPAWTFIANAYYGRNIQSSGSSSALSTASFSGSQREAGGYITPKWNVASNARVFSGFGLSRILSRSEQREGDLYFNRVARLGGGIDLHERVELFLETTHFWSSYHWTGLATHHSTAALFELGLIARL